MCTHPDLNRLRKKKEEKKTKELNEPKCATSIKGVGRTHRQELILTNFEVRTPSEQPQKNRYLSPHSSFDDIAGARNHVRSLNTTEDNNHAMYSRYRTDNRRSACNAEFQMAERLHASRHAVSSCRKRLYQPINYNL